MTNTNGIKRFEDFVSEMDRSEEIEKELTDVPVENEDDETSTHVQVDEDNASDEDSKVIPVHEMLEKCYEVLINEATEWAKDAHDDHTIESYMAENAALVASMAAKTLTVLQEDMKTEAYEACLNKMTEAYSKKINEMKEMKDATDMEDIEL